MNDLQVDCVVDQKPNTFYEKDPFVGIAEYYVLFEPR